MRLHTLRLHAVGPFADEQVVDFDRLGAGGLFLFEGPTGVGKSTILDALTFALYGGIASEAGDLARMRSDFADTQTRPEVCLEFSVRGGRHRITRSPEYARPKRRGTGVTREKSSVHLERRTDAGWETRSHAKDEAGTIVGELLGLTREQFRQVVLLPQGEFATFLRSGDDERREVLGRLFGTQFFGRITESLQARAQESARALEAADADLRARVSAACEAAGLDAEGSKHITELPAPDKLARLGELGAELARQVGDREEGAALADAAAGLAHRELSMAELTCARVAQRGAMETAIHDAERERPEHEARCSALTLARQAVPVGPLVEVADRAAERVASLRGCLSAPSSNAGVTVEPEHLRGEGWQVLAGSAAAARTRAGGLAHVVLIEDGLAAGRSVLVEKRSVAASLLGSLQLAEERARHLPDEIGEARAALGAAQHAASSVSGTRALLEAMAGPAAAAARLAELRPLLDQLRAARRIARREFEEANDHHELLVGQRLMDVRGQLAAKLVSGDPCLVCGSSEHPAPARTFGGGVSDAQVSEAATRRDDARLMLDDAELALVRTETALEHAEAASGGQTAAQWQARMDELVGQMAAGELARTAITGLASREAALLAEQAALAVDLMRLTEERARAHAEEEHAAADLAQRESQVATARADCGSVRERAAALVAEAAALDAHSTAVQGLARAIDDQARATERAQLEAGASGFTTLEQARAALLSATELESLAQVVQQWQAGVATARAMMDSAELRAVAGLDPEWATEQVRRAAERSGAAEEASQAAQGALSVATRQRDRFSERHDEVRDGAAQRAALSASGEEVVALDKYARGMAGAPRMTLVTFVLRYWFEQVVAAANIRLESMSTGKYELLRVDRGARMHERVGLGLAVLDRHTGRERSPATLSGGETFYTSLALALGLADVVVAQAGGAQLDTLFIDEGFGSLDADTLDDVMGVIDDLRGNGRVIGIVSHVPELKERIAERLSVRRISPEGPSLVEVRA